MLEVRPQQKTDKKSIEKKNLPESSRPALAIYSSSVNRRFKHWC